MSSCVGSLLSYYFILHYNLMKCLQLLGNNQSVKRPVKAHGPQKLSTELTQEEIQFVVLFRIATPQSRPLWVDGAAVVWLFSGAEVKHFLLIAPLSVFHKNEQRLHPQPGIHFSQ